MLLTTTLNPRRKRSAAENFSRQAASDKLFILSRCE
jgi:hypothetical protein